MRFAALLCAAAAFAQDISPRRLRAHVRFLASDLLEGRAPGTRGGDLAVEYIASQLAVAGARPMPDGYFQPVPLVASDPAAMSLSATRDGQEVRFAWRADFAGGPLTQREHEELDAEAVFAGYGITAPEFGWDDYAGIDVKGKVAVMFANEPPSADDAFFGGRALTYYGRWTYKFEQALRKGAAGAILLHTDATAGYAWDVVRNSWGKEQVQVRVQGEALRFAGWLSSEAAARLLAGTGHTVDGLRARAGQRGFRGFPLGARVRASMTSRLREIAARNVLGRIEGADPAAADEAVVFTAHWDHLGRDAEASGDAIYNGAVDNATGCAVLLEIARQWSDLPRKPRRSAVFLFPAAEESGLLGSEYHVSRPAVPLSKTALVLNFDSIAPGAAVAAASVDGVERTTFRTRAETTAARLGLTLEPPTRPELGGFFRSDHFPFAKAGVAAVSVKGVRAAGPGPSTYHRPSDEYREDWDFASLEQMARLGMALGLEAANADDLVRWVEPRKPERSKPLVRKKR